MVLPRTAIKLIFLTHHDLSVPRRDVEIHRGRRYRRRSEGRRKKVFDEIGGETGREEQAERRYEERRVYLAVQQPHRRCIHSGAQSVGCSWDVRAPRRNTMETVGQKREYEEKRGQGTGRESARSVLPCNLLTASLRLSISWHNSGMDPDGPQKCRPSRRALRNLSRIVNVTY